MKKSRFTDSQIAGALRGGRSRPGGPLELCWEMSPNPAGLNQRQETHPRE